MDKFGWRKNESPDLNPGGNNTIYNASSASGPYNITIVLRQYGNEQSSMIGLYIKDIQDIATTTYILNSSEKNGYYQKTLLDVYNANLSSVGGTITINYIDKINKIISGTFSFKAINASGQTVNVSEGRFDKKFL